MIVSSLSMKVENVFGASIASIYAGYLKVGFWIFLARRIADRTHKIGNIEVACVRAPPSRICWCIRVVGQVDLPRWLVTSHE
jgi:hypothetical protein